MFDFLTFDFGLIPSFICCVSFFYPSLFFSIFSHSSSIVSFHLHKHKVQWLFKLGNRMFTLQYLRLITRYFALEHLSAKLSGIMIHKTLLYSSWTITFSMKNFTIWENYFCKTWWISAQVNVPSIVQSIHLILDQFSSH